MCDINEYLFFKCDQYIVYKKFIYHYIAEILIKSILKGINYYLLKSKARRRIVVPIHLFKEMLASTVRTT